jgi:hypothetical protein
MKEMNEMKEKNNREIRLKRRALERYVPLQVEGILRRIHPYGREGRRGEKR